MKGRYGKGHMMIYGHILPGAASIARSGFWEDKLTEQAKHRLRAMGWHKKNGETQKHSGVRHRYVSNQNLATKDVIILQTQVDTMLLNLDSDTGFGT